MCIVENQAEGGAYCYMNKSNRFFKTARPVRLFFMVALPGLISMLSMSLYQAFEGSFVGHSMSNNQFCTAKAYECAAALMMEILEGNYEVIREIWAANTIVAENL